jgi:hypothetical protein
VAAAAAPSAAAAPVPEAGGPVRVTGGDSQADGFIPAPTAASEQPDDAARTSEPTLRDTAGEGPPAAVVISGLLLVLGLGLFVLRWIARSQRTT